MIRALTTAATGLEAQQANIERISTDLANVNTDGYKRGRTEFEDLIDRLGEDLSRGLRATSVVIVPAAVGMAVLATPLSIESADSGAAPRRRNAIVTWAPSSANVTASCAAKGKVTLACFRDAGAIARTASRSASASRRHLKPPCSP